jgi:hypothetical protein
MPSVAPNPAATHLLRRTIRPYGKGQITVTLSLWNSGIPCPDAASDLPGVQNWIVYRLYAHMPRKKAQIVFEGADQPPQADMDDVAVNVLDRLTRLPGDPGAEDESWTPEQLDFVLKHGRALRIAATERLAWSMPSPAQLRLGFEVIYTRRADTRANFRHHYSAGVLGVAARTKTEAKAAFGQAIGSHLSALPEFRVGAVSKEVYALYPHGTDWVIQVIDPTKPQAPLGESLRFAAATSEEAKGILTQVQGKRESTRPVVVPEPAGVTMPPFAASGRKATRPKARASIMPSIRVPRFPELAT